MYTFENDRGICLSQGADVPGAVLIVTSLMLGVYTIVEAAERSWGSAHPPRCGPAATGHCAVA